MSGPERVLIEHYRCPEMFLNFKVRGDLSEQPVFFTFGTETTCYGRLSVNHPKPQLDPVLCDPTEEGRPGYAEVHLPFDPSEIVDNLRLERYPSAQDSKNRTRARKLYYLVRPVLPGSVRRQIQRSNLRGWGKLSFPSWPVDRSVESIHEQLLILAVKSSATDRIPFIWFWPEGAAGCVVMTHDVETQAGKDFCTTLMDIDDSFGIKASFQIVPEQRYSVSSEFLQSIRNRGFEIGIQDLNHDGCLFNNRPEFLRRTKLINEYARVYGAEGFRAAALYRKPDWYDALEFSFEMSIPNTAHLDPQRGGCCTVMPYFIGNMLELPVTTTQDYMLFHLMRERSIELWKKQIRLILDKNGFISFIVHPDYVIDNDMMALYEELLNYLRHLQATANLWFALPSEVDRWWRARSKMQLVRVGGEWRIKGEGCERAVVAYAKNSGGTLTYELPQFQSPLVV